MILEERDYRLSAGSTGEFLRNYEAKGLEIQRAHLGEPVGFFTVEIGELNHVVSMWRFDSLADRAERRERMLADPRWPDYVSSTKGMIEVQNIRILTPSSFSPLG